MCAPNTPLSQASRVVQIEHINEMQDHLSWSLWAAQWIGLWNAGHSSLFVLWSSDSILGDQTVDGWCSLIDLYKFLFFATHLIRLYMNRFQTHHVSFWEYRSILTLLPILGVNIYIYGLHVLCWSWVARSNKACSHSTCKADSSIHIGVNAHSDSHPWNHL